MGSDERRSVLRRRMIRRDIAGTPTSSPDVSIFSEDRPEDDHETELAMLDAIRQSNPDMDDNALVAHLTFSVNAAESERDFETVRDLQRMINLINFKKDQT